MAWLFVVSLLTMDSMLPPARTVRQRLRELLVGARLSSYHLAQMLGISEREVEEHLVHVVKTLSRDPTCRFILEPSACPDCGFVFRERTKLTQPSRCPRCRSDSVTVPHYGIDSVCSRSNQTDGRTTSGRERPRKGASR